MNKLLLILLVLTVCACKREPALSVTVIDRLSTNKSYAGLYDESLTDVEFDSIQGNNPAMDDKRLEKAGLIKAGSLLTEKFAFKNFNLYNGQRDTITVKYGDVMEDGLRKIYMGRGVAKDTIKADYNSFIPLLSYAADIIPGGYKEIITLNQWYLMNNDVFEVIIYEVKTSD